MLTVKRMLLLQLASAALLLPPPKTALAGARNAIPGSRYLSARAAGMGDALLNFSDDAANGLFVNPAGLATGKPMTAELLNLTLETNQDFMSGMDINSIKATSLPAYFPSLPVGEYPSLGYTLLPTFQAPGFGFGLLLQTRVSASAEGGTVSYRSSYRFVPALGVGTRLAGGLFRIGYSLQFVNQAEGEVTRIPATSSPMGYNQQLNQGSGIAHHFGATISIPITYLPTFSVVARNVLGTRFSNFSLINFARNTTGVPATEPMTIDAAFSLQPRFRGGGFVNWVLQVKDATNRSGFKLLDRSTLGVEINFNGAFAIRGGYTLGAPQAGFGFKTSRADINLSWHTEELGTPNASVRDRKWMLQYQMKAF